MWDVGCCVAEVETSLGMGSQVMSSGSFFPDAAHQWLIDYNDLVRSNKPTQAISCQLLPIE